MSVRKEEGDKHAHNVITCQVMTDGASSFRSTFILFTAVTSRCTNESAVKYLGINVDACQCSPNMQVDPFSLVAPLNPSP